MLALKQAIDVCNVEQLSSLCECANPNCKGHFVLGGGAFAEVWFQNQERGLYTCVVAFCSLSCVLEIAKPQGSC